MFKLLLNKISDKIIQSNQYNNNGLLSGTMGEIIYLYEYSRVNKKYSSFAQQRLSRMYESIFNGNIFPTYCAGLAGIGSGIIYLQERNFISKADISPEIDYYIIAELEKLLNEKNFDFLHGAIGIGFYFLDRLKTNKNLSKKYLKIILSSLNENAETNDIGFIKWRKDRLVPVYDLSIAHGISSIVIFLCKIVEIGITENKETLILKENIHSAINFILSTQLDVNKYKSYFPYSFKENTIEESRGSRLAWCYGDLSISIALLFASKILRDNKLYLKALEIIDFSSARRNLKENLVFDACLCHGSAGLALIFYDFFKKTGNIGYYNTSKYWIDKTIEFCNPQHNIELFKVYYDMKKGIWSPRLSMLEGLSGIGLTILSFFQSEEPYWDKFMLLR